MFQLQTQTRGEQTALIEEMVGNQKVVQAFCHEKEALGQFADVNDRLQKYSLRATFFSSLVNPSTRFVNSLVYAAVGITGALAVILTGGAFSVGNLSCFLSYANQYTKPFNEISGVVTELQNALACAARFFELIEVGSGKLFLQCHDRYFCDAGRADYRTGSNLYAGCHNRRVDSDTGRRHTYRNRNNLSFLFRGLPRNGW